MLFPPNPVNSLLPEGLCLDSDIGTGRRGYSAGSWPTHTCGLPLMSRTPTPAGQVRGPIGEYKRQDLGLAQSFWEGQMLKKLAQGKVQQLPSQAGF